MRKTYLYLILSLALAMPWLNGCIKEDRDDCKAKVTLRFRYVGDGATDIFPEKIDQVTMYVYSLADGSLVGTYEYDESALNAYQGADINLFPGMYKVVCWGNVFENTTIREGDRIAAPGYFNNNDITTNDRLYYGTVELEIPETLEERDYICNFVSSHVKFQVRLEGFKGALIPDLGVESSAPLSLSLTNLASYTDFDNVPSEAERCSYYPELSEDPDDPQSYITFFNTLRFNDDNDIMLQVHAGTRTVIYEFGLADFLSRFQIPVEGHHEVLVPILIRAGVTGIEIQDWEREPVNPGFDKE